MKLWIDSHIAAPHAEMLPSSVIFGDCGILPEVVPEGAKVNAKFDGWMMPADIKFTQASISSVFSRIVFQRGNNGEMSRGTLCVDRLPILTIRDTLRQLQNGELKVEQIPPIRVCQHTAHWYSLDNRRLWVFKQYGRPVPVIIGNASREFFQKFQPGELNGETVSIREPNEMAAKMEDNCPTFSSIVLKWSIENIMNDNMYSNKVRPVPRQFSDPSAYFEAFKWPLLEDTHGHLRRNLEDIGSKPYVPLRYIVEDIKNKNMTQFKTFEMIIEGRGRVVRRSKCDDPWAPKSNDLALLTTFVPEGLEDFGRYGELYSIALIASSNDDDEVMPDDRPFEIKVKAYMHSESPEYSSISDVYSKRNWYLVFLDSLVTGTRIWEALADLALEDVRHEVADEILCPENMQDFTSGCALQEDEILPSLKAAVEDYCHLRELNSSQSEAVTTEITSLMRRVGRRVSLIQGPPGTGKTKTTTAILSIAACLKDRVLVSAPTNRAISEVAERMLLTDDGPSHASFFSHYRAIATADSLTERQLSRKLQLGDMVMVGNKKKLETDGILGKIFLSQRVKRLRSALSPVTGWNANRDEMLDVLRGGLESFRLQEESKKGNQTEETVDFLQYTKNTLNRVGRELIISGLTLCNDLPTKLWGRRWDDPLCSKLLSPAERQHIRCCCNLTQKLLESVAEDGLSAGVLMQCFSGDGLKCILLGHEFSKASLFCSTRRVLLEHLSRAPACELAPVGLENLCLRNAGVVFCTTSSAGSWHVERCGSFDYAIIDEAAQVVEAETAIITRLPGLQRLLLVGDPKQLQALVISQIAKDCDYGRSLFERLQASGYACHMLNEQYRMHPAISYFPNHRFYRGAVLDGANVKSEGYRKPYQDLYGSYAFINVEDGEERRGKRSQTWKNRKEADVVRDLILKIRATVPTEENQHLDIGVITPYRGQKRLLQKRLSDCGVTCVTTGPSNQMKNADVTVNTVNGFQGGEKDVIIFSAVRANVRGNIGFLQEPRRVNVALTRGRYCVWIVGHAHTLGMRNQLWRELIEDARERGRYWNWVDDPKIRAPITQVNSEGRKYNTLLRQDATLFTGFICQGKGGVNERSRWTVQGLSTARDGRFEPQINEFRNQQLKAVDAASFAETSATLAKFAKRRKSWAVRARRKNLQVSKPSGRRRKREDEQLLVESPRIFKRRRLQSGFW